MMPVDSRKRLRYAAGGLFAVFLLVGAAVTAVAYSGGAFDSDPEVTVVVPASAGQLKPQSAVQFRGVVVGTVTEVRGDVEESTLTLRISPAQLGLIPGSVKARLLPRTLFGDTYVDLNASGPAAEPLHAGARVAHDDTAATAQLYTVGRRLYDLVTAVQPAKLSGALGAVADVLRGRGAELGGMIDRAGQLARDAGPLTDTLFADLSQASDLARQLAASAPDLFRALDNAVSLSDTLVQRKEDLRRLLAAGTQGAGTVENLLRDNADRTIQLVGNLDPILTTMNDRSGALRDTVTSLGTALDAVRGELSNGPWLTLKAPLTFDSPYPYTAKDCPRYGSLAGPNCGAAAPQRPAAPPPAAPAPVPQGAVGPVGGEQEKKTISEVMTGPPDLLSLLLGPLLRGAKVVTGG
ncbi:MCE family protein [Amycolatopsis anabasis]|uniref:MCE family protein n=1 Tax=Amycolatopsis anabasis TaxID=1840409 RepID=UPI00131AA602|nr:MCE family protein [Amycolatopsis anabasis]